MAAAVSSRSRGAAGGLFFLFTLLGLVCTAASLMDENKLKHFKELLQDEEQDLEKAKAQRDTNSEIINNYVSLLDPIMALEFLERVKGFMEETESSDGMNIGILEIEHNLSDEQIIIRALEDFQSEL
ncbi:ADP-ribosylation factor-like protein 2-binding protein [Dissostichus eleginoides]|uniref:ADP-ribosylation factor-like protein 2-binding protein n=1 Tax=Dissostichus eleginoides TaxID=100907 RepID=A0AAD9F6U0_DISEL|nr:ADP-ribosylation factor-like protein 2-binding protein [Dissostichus eleginoides]